LLEYHGHQDNGFILSENGADSFLLLGEDGVPLGNYQKDNDGNWFFIPEILMQLAGDITDSPRLWWWVLLPVVLLGAMAVLIIRKRYPKSPLQSCPVYSISQIYRNLRLI
jgi:hypothetical protein